LLFVRSFRNLAEVPLGFERSGILIVNAGLPQPAPPAAAIRLMKQDVVNRLRTMPGVEAVGETWLVPLSGGAMSNSVWMDGTDRAQAQTSLFSRIAPGYFETLRMPLLAGRDFTDQDTSTSKKVAIVNETFARTFAGGGNPVGRHFWIEVTPTTPETLYEIVGLVKDAKYRTLREQARPVAFLAIDQQPPGGPGSTFLVRSSTPFDVLVPAVTRTLLDVNPNLRFVFRELDTQIRETLIRDRAMAMLSGLFGILAALLAAIGLHGLIAYTVERKRREIGIRLALGANRSSIVGSLVRENALWVTVGLLVGVPVAIALTRTAQSLLFGLQPIDPASLVAAVAGLSAVALTASYLPAQRAARLDPMAILKEE
jgi:predicted permease